MTVHVLVPIDGSPQSTAALELAADLYPDGRITLLHVVDPVGHVGTGFDESTEFDQLIESQQNRAQQLFEKGKRILAETTITIDTAVATGSPWREIVEYTDEHDVDHVFMGSHGRDGPGRVLLGSVAELVVRRTTVPVTVVKADSIEVDE